MLLMKEYMDLTGDIYGRWTVLERIPGRRSGDIMWLCRCECGETRPVAGKRLRSGITKSCGAFGCRTEPTYYAMHQHLWAVRGKASAHPCVRCGKQAQDWAYDNTDPDERRDTKRNGSAYSLDVERYQPMCKSCHIAGDHAVHPWNVKVP
jgi:hypothetical protein